MRLLLSSAVLLLLAAQSVYEPKTCGGTDKLSGVGADGVFVCSADETGAGGSIPQNAILPFSAGPCPQGYTEWGDGKFMRGVTHASGNAGTTGGSDDITSVLDHTHTVNVNDPGHAHTTQRYPTATGGSSGFTIDTSMSGTLADNTLPTKSATTGITATTANPAGGVASIDNRPAHINVVFCQKQ